MNNTIKIWKQEFDVWLREHPDQETHDAYIIIQNAHNPGERFTRKITDISQYPDKWIYIISWEPKDE
jgi:hypothetical protein